LSTTIVVGCGNRLCTDDAAGLEAVRQYGAMDVPDHVCVVEAGCPGYGLLDLIAGFKRAILVDAVVSGAPPGTIHRFAADALPPRELLPLSSHGVNMIDALTLGRMLAPGSLPPRIVIIGIEVSDRTPYCEGLTPAVASALPKLIAAIRTAASAEEDNNAPAP
jgi:hydrogenase maturation protease